jgi:hypothetical protein
MNAEQHTRRAHKEDRDRIGGQLWPVGDEKPQPQLVPQIKKWNLRNDN